MYTHSLLRTPSKIALDKMYTNEIYLELQARCPYITLIYNWSAYYFNISLIVSNASIDEWVEEIHGLPIEYTDWWLNSHYHKKHTWIN
jgi:hypothetical protein